MMTTKLPLPNQTGSHFLSMEMVSHLLLSVVAFASILCSPSYVFADVVLTAESNGFPGSHAAADAILQISLKKSTMRIINSRQYHVVTIDMKNNLFREFSGYHKAYEQKTVTSFEALRMRREKHHREAIKVALGIKDKKEQKLAIKALRKDGIEINGLIVAKTERLKKVRLFKVRVDGVLRTVNCTRIYIRENNALKPCFDLWVTKDLNIKDNFLRFYELGTFSKAVIAELKKIKEFPLRVEALVDTGGPKKRIHCEVKSVENEAVPEWALMVPKSFKKVPSLKELMELRQAEGPAEICADCGTLIELGKKAESFSRNTLQSRRQYKFCNTVCRKSFIKGKKWKLKK